MQTTVDHADIRIIPPIYFGCGFVLGLLLNRLLPAPSLKFSWAVPLGGIFIVGSLFFAFWAIYCFRQVGTSVDVRRPTTMLVDSGPYAISRNPLYVANCMLFAGLAFVADIFWLMPMIPVLMVVIYWVAIKKEEAYLENKFGDCYKAYKRRVRRWI